METKVFKENIEDAVDLLKQGQVVAFPTETVYGLGGDATNPEAIQKVFAAKGRPSDNPLIITVANPEMVARYADITEDAQKIIETFWPDSITIILNLKSADSLPEVATSGLSTAAFRMPDNLKTLELISILDRPIVGPSANTSTKPSPTTAQHVLDDLDGVIAGIVDDGPTSVGVESTILDLSTDQPTILRPGKITAELIREVLGEVVEPDLLNLTSTEGPKAPGMKYRHYAPSREVVTFDDLDLKKLSTQLTPRDSVLAFEDILNQLDSIEQSQKWSLGQTAKSASEELFAGLRYFDNDSDGIIYVQRMPEIGIGKAYNNRLNKASSGKILE
ncbi:MAG: threonylcarbamoyl-AMP synthase [Lactobacillaceae bacterium]|jgi:L-threonylcarbamoyladenylate synthase|nr:threonylcarbamoyl-AMP synthase [Lactobacillaceae bacterium]